MKRGRSDRKRDQHEWRAWVLAFAVMAVIMSAAIGRGLHLDLPWFVGVPLAAAAVIATGIAYAWMPSPTPAAGRPAHDDEPAREDPRLQDSPDSERG